MQAIETPYAGIRFRSRLEARWAVFFTELGIDWKYEFEGFKLKDGTRYVPDFWLPTFNGGMWVEVKPKGGDFSKAEKLAKECGDDVWFAEGEPSYNYQHYYSHGLGDDLGMPNWCDAEGEDRMYYQADTWGLCDVYDWKNGQRIPCLIERAAIAACTYRFDW